MRALGIIGRLLAVVASVLVGVPVACVGTLALDQFVHTYTYRYRMTIEVDVDGETKSGSSVIQVQMTKQGQWIVPVPPYVTYAKGEAVFVDLGEGRNVIGLLVSGPNGQVVDYPKYIVPQHFKLSNSDADVKRYPHLEGNWVLPRDQLPTLVTFTNLKDPTTARVVQPGEFGSVFGDSVRFERVFVEMVAAGTWPFSVLGWPPTLAGEPVTKGIAERFPWWNGPFPWLECRAGMCIDTRKGPFRLNKGLLKRSF